jgi:arsenate reductase
MLKIYTYAQCGTCRQAVKWLEGHGIAFAERPIRETPPSRVELERMLAACGGELKRLCNTSGCDYRALQLGEKLAVLGVAGTLALLEHNGNLVKRPFLHGSRVALVGFGPARWAQALAPDA